MVHSRPDLINLSIADANLDCATIPPRNRENCARAEFERVYPRWRYDQNADLIEGALGALGRINAQEAAGTLDEQTGVQIWATYYTSLLQIADARITDLAQRRAAQSAAMQVLSRNLQTLGQNLQAISRPPAVSVCDTSVMANGRFATTTCTQ